MMHLFCTGYGPVLKCILTMGTPSMVPNTLSISTSTYVILRLFNVRYPTAIALGQPQVEDWIRSASVVATSSAECEVIRNIPGMMISAISTSF